MTSRNDSFEDQHTARERAANFFALAESLQSIEVAAEAWAWLDRLVDASKPLPAPVGTAIGRLDLNDDEFKVARKRILQGFLSLKDTDLVIERGRAGYPSRLAATGDAPLFLFVRQHENVLDLQSISIVGTRRPSDEGRGRARRLAYLLARRGMAICSGLALGIDEEAHLGALEAGGITIGVLGTPITRVSPKEHAALQERVGFVGALVSQFHPASATLPLCFPLRNATMSGLSLGTVVIEASETSGALVQARKALQQQRKLFIPKSAVDNPTLRWPKRYAAHGGAYVFGTLDELIEVLEAENIVPKREADPATATVVELHAS